MSWWGNLAGRFTRSEDEDEAEELRGRSGTLGAVPIAEAAERTRVEVSGVIRNLTHPPVTSGARLFAAELYDGTAPLTLVWLGRRGIAGIAPGVHLRAHGRMSMRGGKRTMFNPRYEILPSI